VFELYYRELLNFLTRKVRDRDEAADLTQECYARMLALTSSGEVIAAPRAMLYRIARNLVVDQHRRRVTYGDADSPEDCNASKAVDAIAAPAASEPEETAMSAQGVDALLATIDALPPRCREAFILHKFDGLSHAEVAEQMGVSRKMVEQHVKIALTACRQCRARLETAPTTGPGPRGIAARRPE